MCPYLSMNSFFLKHFKGPLFFMKEEKNCHGILVDVDDICVDVLSWIQTYNSKMFRNNLRIYIMDIKIFHGQSLSPYFSLNNKI